MEITIIQNKISIGEKYEIYVGQNLTYKAKTKVFKFWDEISLFKYEQQSPIYILKQKFSFLKVKYDLHAKDNSVYQLRQTSLNLPNLTCKVHNDVYRLIVHYGLKTSIYKNEKQIGYWTKKAVSWFSGDEYKIVTNDNVDKELIISFCLILDKCWYSHNKSIFNFDLGHIWYEEKSFNEKWQPNQ